jgi:hypothetical protein
MSRAAHDPLAFSVIAVALTLVGGVAMSADVPAKKNPRPAKPATALSKVKLPEATPDQEKAAELVYYGAYECEFNENVNILASTTHHFYVDVKHGKTTWLMKPVLSTTGAVRLEDVKGETPMVQIASKSMLLNVKTRHRIVDACISPRQRELLEAAKTSKPAEAPKAGLRSPPAARARQARTPHQWSRPVRPRRRSNRGSTPKASSATST